MIIKDAGQACWFVSQDSMLSRLSWVLANVPIKRLQIFGDSKAIVDWFNGKSTLASLFLELWQRKVHALKESFNELKVSHTHRTFNYVVNCCSKFIHFNYNQMEKIFIQSSLVLEYVLFCFECSSFFNFV